MEELSNTGFTSKGDHIIRRRARTETENTRFESMIIMVGFDIERTDREILLDEFFEVGDIISRDEVFFIEVRAVDIVKDKVGMFGERVFMMEGGF